MQTTRGPQCDICGHIILQDMDCVAIPGQPTPFTGHRECNLPASKLAKSWGRISSALQSMHRNGTADIDRFNCSLEAAYNRYSYRYNKPKESEEE